MKVFISFDYEGLGGISSWSETLDNQYQNNLATQQINAFCNGIFEKNKNAEIVICDSHAYGRNILWDKLDKRITLIRGFPRKYYMMEGFDRSFTHIVFFGYHSAVGGGGILDHTYSSSSIFEIKINNEVVDEALINSYYASHFDGKVYAVYADNITYNFLKSRIENYLNRNNLKGNYEEFINFIVSKTSISRFAGIMKPFNQLLDELFNAGKNLDEKKGFKFETRLPAQIEITFLDSVKAYMCSSLPFVELIEPRKIVFNVDNFKLMYNYLMSIIYIAGSSKNIT